jgi:hypothetical protein
MLIHRDLLYFSSFLIFFNFLCSEHYKKIEGKCTLDIDNKHEAKFESWFLNRMILQSGMILELQSLEVVL